jgi:hypothetical protein
MADESNYIEAGVLTVVIAIGCVVCAAGFWMIAFLTWGLSTAGESFTFPGGCGWDYSLCSRGMAFLPFVAFFTGAILAGLLTWASTRRVLQSGGDRVYFAGLAIAAYTIVPAAIVLD